MNFISINFVQADGTRITFGNIARQTLQQLFSNAYRIPEFIIKSFISVDLILVNRDNENCVTVFGAIGPTVFPKCVEYLRICREICNLPINREKGSILFQENRNWHFTNMKDGY